MTYAASPFLRRQDNALEEKLQPATRAWMAQLPSCLALPALGRHYPRIANRIAGLWGQPAQCARYIDELLFNDRPEGRRGFPPAVYRDIMQLKYALTEAFTERSQSCAPAFA